MMELIVNVISYIVAIAVVALAILLAPSFVNWLLDCFGVVLFFCLFVGSIPAILLAAIVAVLKD